MLVSLSLTGTLWGQSPPKKEEEDRPPETKKEHGSNETFENVEEPLTASDVIEDKTSVEQSQEETVPNEQEDATVELDPSLDNPPSQNGWYVRPNAKTRFHNYLGNVAGSVSLMRSAAVAGVLTARNAPKEWNGTWGGFGRRFASSFGENTINHSVRYGLDELLKTDSNFYRSANGGPVARARNAVFSAITSRDRRGRRVFGVSKVAGALVSNVITVEMWYPDRYNRFHGVKGAGISLLIDIGQNLFREFVWKR